MQPEATKGLSQREVTLLELELAGYGHRERAALLCVSYGAARKAWQRLMAKCRALPRADAAEAVYRASGEVERAVCHDCRYVSRHISAPEILLYI